MRHKEDEYTYRVWWSNPDASYMADVMELPGVLAFGDTPEDALRNARDVTRVWLEDVSEDGQRLPAPRGHSMWVARELRALTAEPVSAEDVRIIRRNLGLTQRAFADVLGVSLNTVQAWEQGVNAPSGAGQHLLRLIDALNDAITTPPQLQEAGSITS